MEGFIILLFVLIFLLILIGVPVSFVLGGASVIVGLLYFGLDFFNFLPPRIMGVVSNPVLMAVPLFIFMGMMLEKSELAASMLKGMSQIIGRNKGGLAIATIIVGSMLAASSGVVGATVVSMGLISLPPMLSAGYDKKIATGTIAASGSLGQIIPPSIVLILLGSVLNVSVGKLFTAAILPGGLLVLFYLIYVYSVFIIGGKKMEKTQETIEKDSSPRSKLSSKEVRDSFVMPFLLILLVLGSIFLGIATPTESAALGAFGALLLAIYNRKFSRSILSDVLEETVHLSAMVFFILFGATTFSLVFRGLGGDDLFTNYITSLSLGPHAFLFMVLIIIFFLGFFLDFIEIIFIVVPIVAPLLQSMGFEMIWIGILIAMVVQTSFLTPPFGFSLFYLKGVSPPSVDTMDIYRGVIPFIIIQIGVIILLYLFPNLLSFSSGMIQ